MAEKVESAEEIRRDVVKELKTQALKALAKIENWVVTDEFDRAIGGLGTVRYIIECAREWMQP